MVWVVARRTESALVLGVMPILRVEDVATTNTCCGGGRLQWIWSQTTKMGVRIATIRRSKQVKAANVSPYNNTCSDLEGICDKLEQSMYI